LKVPTFIQRVTSNHRRANESWTLDLWLAFVSIAGVCALAFTIVSAGWASLADEVSLELVALAILVVLGELLTIKIPRLGTGISSSTAFVFALMLVSGVPAAMIALAVASALGDVRERKSVLSVTFNIGQMCLAVAAAGLVLTNLTDLPRAFGPPVRGSDLPEFCAAGAAFFITNNLLNGTAVSLSLRIPLPTVLRTDIAFQILIAGVFLSLAPVIARAAADDLILVVMLVLPLLSVYRSGRDAMLSAHQALHDGLTGLPNRMFYTDRAAQLIEANEKQGLQLAVMMVDLDKFKEINDWLGHHYGDLLLQEIGPRLSEALRETDIVARMGGDEFAILLPQVPDHEAASLVAQKVLDSLLRPFDIKGLSLTVGASIGIAFGPEHGNDVDTLLQRADVAMYNAKGSGGGYELYSRERDYSPDRIALAEEIQQAVDSGDIILHYQPIVELRTKRIVGVEALARWTHPERGVISPTEFIPVAEQSGLIDALTMDIVRRGIRERNAWGTAGSELILSVNVSPRQLLDMRFPEELAVVLARHGTAASTLKLEITESVMGDPNRLREVLDRLRAMGVRLSIDDFGTGYSSLAHLTSLSVDEIKIDRSFVMGMSTNANDAQIVRSTVMLAHNLGLAVVAEGVETEEARDALLAQGCDYAQGYFLSRPLPPDQFEAWIQHHEAGTRSTRPLVDAEALLDVGSVKPSFEERLRAREAATGS
jgi:diguanylate cyclase (GGDEF)-like protein